MHYCDAMEKIRDEVLRRHQDIRLQIWMFNGFQEGFTVVTHSSDWVNSYRVALVLQKEDETMTASFQPEGSIEYFQGSGEASDEEPPALDEVLRTFQDVCKGISIDYLGNTYVLGPFESSEKDLRMLEELGLKNLTETALGFKGTLGLAYFNIPKSGDNVEVLLARFESRDPEELESYLKTLRKAKAIQELLNRSFSASLRSS